MSTTMDHVLEINGLHRSFFGKKALVDVTFAVPRASLTVILGPAGAGKTTTLRMVAGLDKPDAGEVILGGRNVAGWEPKDRDVAMIFDNLALYPNKSGYQNIASPLKIRGESDEVIHKRVQEVAAILQVAHILDRLPKTMSGGERQRIALGRALIRTPQLFLLDEPLSSLDAKLRIELRAELRRMQRDHGYTFLMATPDFHEAMAIADSVIMLREGCIVQVATPQELYDHPVDKQTAQFVGAPMINTVAASMREGHIHFAGGSIPVPPHLHDCVGDEGHAFELGIRPENLALVDRDTESNAGLLEAQLVDVETLGPNSVLTVANDTAELRLLVKSEVTLELTPGQALGLDLVDASRLNAFDVQTGANLALLPSDIPPS